MKKAFIPIFLSFVLLSGSVGIAEAASLTPSQISAIIGLLRSFGADEKIVANVNATLGGTGASGGTTAWCHTFNTNLKIGDTGDEVRALGTVLTKEGFGRVEYREGLIDPISDDGVFIEDTASTVTGFQEKYRDEILTPLGLKYGTGYVGKSTRAKLNALYGCGVTKPPVSAGYLEIEPSSASLAVGGSVSMQAMYQPPMPKCPEGFACPQVMPARYPVVAEWTSSNPSVASVSYKEGPALQSIPIVRTYDRKIGVISGISAGTADIKASYKPSGAVFTATAKVTVGSVSPSITVLSPNGGEIWTKETTQTIKWQDNTSTSVCPVGAQCSPQAPKYYDIKLVTYYPPSPPCTEACPAYPYRVPYTIAKSVYGSSYSWSVGRVLNIYGTEAIIAPDGSYTIQICQTGTTVCDSSDSYFKIVSGTSTNNPPVINNVPAVPVSINVGQSVPFSWGATDADGDNLAWGVSWGEGIGAAGACQSPNPQNKQGWTYNTSHAWSNPGTYTVRATVNDCRGGSSDHVFNVTVGGATQPSITVISPNGGESWKVGETYLIRWTASGVDNVDIILSSSTGYGEIKVATQYSAVTGAYSWTIPSSILSRNDYKIRIEGGPFFEAKGARQYLDESDAPFSIVAAVVNPAVAKITSLSPSLGPVGTKVTISGSGFTAINNVNFAGGTITGLSSSDGRTLSFSVPQTVSPLLNCPAGATCPPPPSFQVVSGIYNVSVENSFGLGSSNVLTFTVTGVIQTPSITVLSPNGGEALVKGKDHIISWTQKGFASDGWIQLQLRDAVNSSTMVKLITPSVPLGAYAGSFNWTVPTDIPDGKYLLWATAGSGLDSLGTRVLGSDFSDAPFTISATPAGAADASSSGGSSFAALLFSLERQLDELERILNSLLP